MKELFLLFISLFLFVSIHANDSLILTKRQLCDLELILNGGFAPLTGFMNQNDYEGVVEDMHLTDGSLWPIPITLDVPQKLAATLNRDSDLFLCASDGTRVATLTVSDIYKPDKVKEAVMVFGSNHPEHPSVAYLHHQTHDYYIGGTVSKISCPSDFICSGLKHYDFSDLRKTPAELKALFKQKVYKKVVAFQTRNPMHRAHQELTLRAAKLLNAHLLIHPVVGQTKPGDVDHFTRVKCYKKLLHYYPDHENITLSLLPLAMRMAGPREALFHAIVRKNYGATHFIVGRDHAGPGKDSSGKDFYGPYEAQELALQYADEIGITIVPFQEMVYVADENTYKPINEVTPETKTLAISGTEFRKMLKLGLEIPEWFSYPDVVKELRKGYPPQHKKGFTIFFTGLSGSGKSTIANALTDKLMELQHRPVTLLDGDLLRQHLSKELGFSKEDRSTHVKRAGFVASEIAKHRGIALCAIIAPYEHDRQFNRNLIETQGGYIEIYVCTPLEVCEQRDPKGLYAKAREGIISNFTGISDPYETPLNSELTIDTSHSTVEQDVEKIICYLTEEGFLKSKKE